VDIRVRVRVSVRVSVGVPTQKLSLTVILLYGNPTLRCTTLVDLKSTTNAHTFRHGDLTII